MEAGHVQSGVWKAGTRDPGIHNTSAPRQVVIGRRDGVGRREGMGPASRPHTAVHFIAGEFRATTHVVQNAS